MPKKNENCKINATRYIADKMTTVKNLFGVINGLMYEIYLRIKVIIKKGILSGIIKNKLT